MARLGLAEPVPVSGRREAPGPGRSASSPISFFFSTHSSSPGDAGVVLGRRAVRFDATSITIDFRDDRSAIIASR